MPLELLGLMASFLGLCDHAYFARCCRDMRKASKLRNAWPPLLHFRGFWHRFGPTDPSLHRATSIKTVDKSGVLCEEFEIDVAHTHSSDSVVHHSGISRFGFAFEEPTTNLFYGLYALLYRQQLRVFRASVPCMGDAIQCLEAIQCRSTETLHTLELEIKYYGDMNPDNSIRDCAVLHSGAWHLSRAIRAFPALTDLRLKVTRGSYEPVDTIIHMAAHSLPNIRVLHLPRPTRIIEYVQTKHIDALAKMPHLVELSICCFPANVPDLAKLKNLEWLRLEFHELEEDMEPCKMPDLKSLIASLPKLRCFWFENDAGAFKPGDENVFLMPDSARATMRRLVWHDCYFDLQSLYSLRGAHCLTDLDVMATTGELSQVLSYLGPSHACKGPQFERLSVEFFDSKDPTEPNIEALLKDIGSNIPTLRHLGIKVGEMSDDIIEAACGIPQLTSLSLAQDSWSYGENDEDLTSLFNSVGHLSELDIGNMGIEPCCVARLLRHSPLITKFPGKLRKLVLAPEGGYTEPLTLCTIQGSELEEFLQDIDLLNHRRNSASCQYCCQFEDTLAAEG